MAHDGKTLLLYMCEQRMATTMTFTFPFLLKDSTWSEPKSLGKKDQPAAVRRNDPLPGCRWVTLYFSSNRPGGIGDNDIWMTRRLDSSWTRWTDPVNLGEPINTPDWDAFLPWMPAVNTLI